MKLVILLMIINCVVSQEEQQLQPPECKNYKVLSSGDRSMSYSQGIDGCDKIKGWYRFTGEAGYSIANKCPAKNHCGTAAPGWMSGSHPTQEEGIVYRKVCFHWLGNCCKLSRNIRVRNCGSFYVYDLVLMFFCAQRYCGNGKVDHCATNPCKNGGNCVNSGESYNCQCPADFGGQNCEKLVDHCATNPCKNGGNCVNSGESYNCQCPADFGGQNCENFACLDGVVAGKCKESTAFKNSLNLLLTDRDQSSPKFSGKTIQWRDWNNYLKDLVCRCSTAAKKDGYKYFGIEFFGECWGGRTSIGSDVEDSRNCYGDDYKECTGDSLCAGAGNNIYTYSLA